MPKLSIAFAVSGVAQILAPKSSSFLASPTISNLSCFVTVMSTPCSSFEWKSVLNPADTSPLNSASIRFLPTPKTSPVDFISGPSFELTSLSFSKLKTGTLTATYGGVL